jgi:hypothetical protein
MVGIAHSTTIGVLDICPFIHSITGVGLIMALVGMVGTITCTVALGIHTTVLVGALAVLFMEVLVIPTMVTTDLVGNHIMAFTTITAIATS